MAACRTVEFFRLRAGTRKRKEPISVVKFCNDELSAGKRSGKKSRAKRILREHACKADGLTPALQKACRSKKLKKASRR